MTMKYFVLLIVFACGMLMQNVSAYRCKKENFFGLTTYFQCPQPGDQTSAVFCCGSEENPFCCDTVLGFDEEELKEFAKSLPEIIGIVIGIIALVIISCLCCCCCCPFCLLYKKRNKGTVITRPDNAAQMPLQTQGGNAPVQSNVYPTQQPSYPSQPAYPTQPAGPQPGYPTQPGYPMQAGYPAPPPGNVYAAQSMQQSAAPYPTQPGPYPTQNMGDQPPPYVEKQQPYNPNY